jgi:DNA polymerase-3 subunit delta
MTPQRKNTASAKPSPPGEQPGDVRLHVVVGEDEYQVSTTARKVVDALCPPDEQALGLEVIDGQAETVSGALEAITRCVQALNTLGFFGGRKVVWLRDVNFFSGGAVAKSEQVKERVQDLQGLLEAGLVAQQALVISAPKIDGRSAFFKTCKARGKLYDFRLPAQAHRQEEQAEEWARQVFHRKGLRIRGGVLEAFLQKVGTDSRQIVQEVEKLLVYLGGRKDVEADDVQAVVSSSRETIAWDLADAVGGRDLPRALGLVRQLLFQGESPVGLIIGLETRFRELLLYRACLDRGWLEVGGTEPWLKVRWSSAAEADQALAALAKDPRETNPFRAGRLAGQARRFSVAELTRGLSACTETHERMVSSGVPPGLNLEFLLLRLLGRRPAPKH